MTIRVQCSCGKRLVYPDTHEGKTLACRACGASLTVAGEKVQVPRARGYRILFPIALVLVIPVSFFTIFIRSQQPRFRSAADEYRDGSKAPIDAKVDGPRIERLFAALAAASKEGNEQAFVSCFHLRRMLAEIEIRGALQTVAMRRDELSLEDELDSTLRHMCDQMKIGFSSWQSVKRCTFRFLEGRGEAEASVVLKSEGHLDRFRFWLIKEKDAWGIFDYESLHTGFRMSTHNGKLLVRQAKGVVSSHALDRASALLDKAQNYMVRNMLDDALETLRESELTAGPGGLMPTVELLRAEVLLRLHRPEEALLKIDDALKLRKDAPPAVQLRGVILHALGRYEESLQSQEEYMLMVGEDPLAYLWIGRACEALGKRDQALQAYRKGAACDEFDSENRQKLKTLEESQK